MDVLDYNIVQGFSILYYLRITTEVGGPGPIPKKCNLVSAKILNFKEHTSAMKYCENHWYCASDIQLVQNILPENAFSMVVLFLSHFYSFLKLKSA